MLRTIYVSIYASIDSESNVYRVRVERRKKYSASAGAARARNILQRSLEPALCGPQKLAIPAL
jgi:hypothetical protein